jgi:L-asparaginase
MQSMAKKIVVLGTGGTIAGTSDAARDNIGYQAARLAVADLLSRIGGPDTLGLECHQVAQVDSKDMSHAVWQDLARTVAHHLGREEVAGIVITHGTDTLEETAYLLHKVLGPAKPVVFTAAMRPATAVQADGPQNLLDALAVARWPGAGGVVVVAAGTIHAAADVRKTHTYRIDAFSSGDAGPLGYVEEGQVRQLRAWPGSPGVGLACLDADPDRWPRVEIVTSHAGADGALVRALVGIGVQGLVVAATGNGTVHEALEDALLDAQAAGVRVVRVSRCSEGVVLARPDDLLPVAEGGTAVKARVGLLVDLLVDRQGESQGVQQATSRAR